MDGRPALDYMHARYYSASLGRFLSVDPIGGTSDIPQSWNRYVYVLNDPVRLIDPTGEKWMDDFCWLCQQEEDEFCFECPILSESITGTAKNPAPWLKPEPSTLDRIGDALGATNLMRAFLGDSPKQFAIGIRKQLTWAFPGALARSGASSDLIVLDDTIMVSRWGRTGLQSGDWVMEGDVTLWNYLRSFKWQPGMGNEYFASGQVYRVPAPSVRWPSGWGLDGWWKGVFGQRRFWP